MSHSLNEIGALCKRAARGAGMSWGMSEEAGRAVRWLEAHRLPGVTLLAGLLAKNDRIAHSELAPTSLSGTWAAPSGSLCPIITGAALTDCADKLVSDQSLEMERVSHPLLVVPFAAWAALHANAAVAITWNAVRIVTDGDRVWLENPHTEISDTVSASMSFTRAPKPTAVAETPVQRGQVDLPSWQKLNALAHRTYAPATEASRILGAGAGVTDND